jgi:integrase
MLTQAFLDSLKPKEGRFEEADSKSPGLRIIVQPSGSMAWALRYRLNGRQGKATLGPYPAISLAEARKKAAIAKATIAKGTDPNAEKRAAHAQAKAKAAEEAKPHDLIESVARTFITRHVKAKRLRTAREIERILEHDVLPEWRARRLSSIGKPDIHELLDALGDRAPIVANRTLGVLKSMGRFAVERGIVERNPFTDVRKPKPEVSRDRVLDEGEVAALMAVLDATDYPVGPLVKMLLLTGQRRSEVAEMRWSEVDLDAKAWRLPAARSKNGREHTLPLPDDVVDMLQGLRRFEAVDFVFSFDGVHPVTGFPPSKAKIDAALAVKLGKPVKPWVLHDLRRTCASGTAEIGVAPHVVERVLNHRSGTIKGVAAVYNRFSYQPEMRAALEAWARRVREIETGEAASNVVDFRPAV